MRELLLMLSDEGMRLVLGILSRLIPSLFFHIHITSLFFHSLFTFPTRKSPDNIRNKHCTKKWGFRLRISSVNVTKSAGNWSHLLKKTLMENSIFCAVLFVMRYPHWKFRTDIMSRMFFMRRTHM